jgi:hypothetical protein
MMQKTHLTLIILTALVFGFFAGQFLLKREIWTGFYYPDLEKIDDQRTWIVSPPLYSLKECHGWVKAVYVKGDNYDYSCGQGCRFTKQYSGETVICKTNTK